MKNGTSASSERRFDSAKAVLAVATAALLISTGIFAFLYFGATRNVATTTVASASTVTSVSTVITAVTATSATVSTPNVGTTFVTHLLNLVSQNFLAVLSDFEPNATVVWKGGSIYDETGNFSTIHYFNGLYGHVLSPNGMYPFLVKNLTYTISTTGDSALVNATYYLVGVYGCQFQAAVNAQESYVLSSGQWLISNEVWNIHNILGEACNTFGG